MGEELSIQQDNVSAGFVDDINQRILTDLQNKIVQAADHSCLDAVTVMRRSLAEVWFKQQREEFPKLLLEALAGYGWVLMKESDL